MKYTTKELLSSDYFVFVDASGDDGIKFDNGSSKFYAASSFVVHKDDLDFNMGILNKIKFLTGTRVADEVKYTKIKKHKNSREIHGLISQLKGSLHSMTYDKIQFCSENGSLESYGHFSAKTFSAIAHTLSIKTIAQHFDGISDVSITIAIDRMKQVEMDFVERLLIHHDVSIEKLPPYKLTFRDSKDTNFQLIQIADFLSGITRDYFESGTNNKNIVEMKRLCPLCRRLNKKICKAQTKNLAVKAYNLYSILPLYKNNPKRRLIESFSLLPSQTYWKYYYLTCPKQKNNSAEPFLPGAPLSLLHPATR